MKSQHVLLAFGIVSLAAACDGRGPDVDGKATISARQLETVTVTQTSTATATGTLTVTESRTSTGTQTATSTFTATITQTATQTGTATGTATATQTLTTTHTVTTTATATGTVTVTVQGTQTSTYTHTATQTKTATGNTTTKTATAQHLNVTGTAVGTVTLRNDYVGAKPYVWTATLTRADTAATMFTGSATATGTYADSGITYTGSGTTTSTMQFSSFAPATATKTVAAHYSGALSKTMLDTGTGSGWMGSITWTYSKTATGTHADTITGTQTLTQSTGGTATVTRTATTTPTVTSTTTSTQTVTTTPTVTSTRTATGTTTPTVTRTATITQTVTSSSTVSNTQTQTVTNTVTATTTATTTGTGTGTGTGSCTSEQTSCGGACCDTNHTCDGGTCSCQGLAFPCGGCGAWNFETTANPTEGWIATPPSLSPTAANNAVQSFSGSTSVQSQGTRSLAVRVSTSVTNNAAQFAVPLCPSSSAVVSVPAGTTFSASLLFVSDSGQTMPSFALLRSELLGPGDYAGAVDPSLGPSVPSNTWFTFQGTFSAATTASHVGLYFLPGSPWTGTIYVDGVRLGTSSGAGSPPGQSMCGGASVDLLNDNANCGSCGNACSGEVCTTGVCCNLGELNCGGSCCDANHSCNGTTCSCQGYSFACGGCGAWSFESAESPTEGWIATPPSLREGAANNGVQSFSSSNSRFSQGAHSLAVRVSTDLSNNAAYFAVPLCPSSSGGVTIPAGTTMTASVYFAPDAGQSMPSFALFMSELLGPSGYISAQDPNLGTSVPGNGWYSFHATFSTAVNASHLGFFFLPGSAWSGTIYIDGVVLGT